MEYFIFIISLSLLVIPLLKISHFHLYDDALIFSSTTNYLLLFSTSLFFFYFHNYLFSLISSLSLIFFTFLLYNDIKRILGYIPFYSYIYLIYNIYTFISILILLKTH